MEKFNAYPFFAIKGVNPRNFSGYFSFWVSLIVILQTSPLLAQREPDFDEISVSLIVPLMGGGEIDAVIKGETLYLPVTNLFDFLKIRNIPSPGLDTISGFFINQEATYVIYRRTNQIRYGDNSFNLEEGALILTESNLYLNSFYFGKIFGLDCIFDFRNLSVTINTKLELPAIREMRQEEMRRNMNRLKGNVKADTSFKRRYPIFHFGVADWSVNAIEQINGKAETRLNLTLGSVIAGGETTISLNYSSTGPFSEKQQYYQWRYVNNSNEAVRQVMLGKISSRAISSIYEPVVGMQITNTPSTFRRSFGSYTLSDKTEPNWIVELYVNNVLIDYRMSDASGFFTFEVPLVYGNSIVRLKFYGPWGEERIRDHEISIPFNFVPKNTLEYTLSAGIVEDTLLSRFSRASLSYGLTRAITVGTGYEYLSSVIESPLMPFVNSSIRLSSNLLLSGEYTYKVRTKATLSYRLPSNLQVDFYYTKYDIDQQAINNNYREERRVVLAMPLRVKNYSAYNRITVNQILLPTTKYSTAEWLFSSSIFGVNTSITTYSLFIGRSTPYVYSNLSFSLRFPSGYTILPQVQYGFTDKKILSAKVGLEKRFLSHIFLNLSYEHNYLNKMRMGELGFRYDFKFAQSGFSVRQTDKFTTLIQYARGSLINDKKTKYFAADNRTNVGKGGITIIPFIDTNFNGKRDRGEQKAFGLTLRASAGRIEKNEQDTTILILGLEPYTDCFIELDQTSFDNISWRLKYRSLNVAVDPNMLKLIEVPVIVVGEASGIVLIDRDGDIRGLGRLIVNFYDKDQKRVGRTFTEEDGYFSYFGLSPGSWTVRIDSVQLAKLKMSSSPDFIKFNINQNIEGDFIDGLDFTVKLTTVKPIVLPERIVLNNDSTYTLIHEVIQKLITPSPERYAIQTGAFELKVNADALRIKLASILGKEVRILIEDGLYKVRITGFVSRQELDEYVQILINNGVMEMWIITLKGNY